MFDATRTIYLLGEEAVRRLAGAHVALFGVGGVGGAVLEALVRAGVGRLTLIDGDDVAPSNLNRQIITDTGNIGVDAILNSKISLAIHNGIPVDYKATVPKETSVTDIDLCVVIGNLIDNAVESCEKVPKEQQFIRLYIGQFKEQLYISVSNATNETVRKLDAEYITHKRGNHGHGLKRINLIVEKYDGFINRKNEAGVFVTEIMLPL